MAEELQTRIIGTMQQCALQIRENMRTLNVNASGRTSTSVHVREAEGHFQLVIGRDGDHNVETPPTIESVTARDTAPAATLEVGRVGGDVPRGFYYIIKQWSKDKGLTFGSESERGTFAYFVARKIAREGTLRQREHVDVYSTPAQLCIKEIKNICRQYLTDTVRAAIGGFSTQSSALHF